MVLKNGRQQETVTLHVVDTTAPVAEFVTHRTEASGYVPVPEDFVVSVEDLSETTLSFAEEPQIPEDYRDLEIHNLYRERLEQGYSREEIMDSIWARGRYNDRTPMQWDDSPGAGFTTGQPWLKINENRSHINVAAALEDPDSVFYHYKKLIELRKTYPVFRDGSFTLLLPEDEKIFAYTRDLGSAHMLVVCNFTDEYVDYEIPENFYGSRLLLSNYKTDHPGLRPYEAAMLYYED